MQPLVIKQLDSSMKSWRTPKTEAKWRVNIFPKFVFSRYLFRLAPVKLTISESKWRLSLLHVCWMLNRKLFANSGQCVWSNIHCVNVMFSVCCSAPKWPKKSNWFLKDYFNIFGHKLQAMTLYLPLQHLFCTWNAPRSSWQQYVICNIQLDFNFGELSVEAACSYLWSM